MGQSGGCGYITWYMLSLVVLCGTVVLHVLSWYQTEVIDDLYDQERKVFWDDWDLNFIPAPWIFWHWVAIYALQVIAFICAFAFLWCKTSPPGVLYSVLSPGGFILLILSNGCVLAWIFLLDKYNYYQYTIICIAGASLFSYIALGLSSRQTFLVSSELRKQVPCTFCLIHILVLNGIGAYATWTFTLLRYHAVILIRAYTDLSTEEILYIFIAINFAFLLVWFGVDIFAVKRPFSFVFTPYIVPVVVSITLMLRKTEYKDLHFIMAVLVVAIYGMLLVVKIGVTIGRERAAQDTPPSEQEGKEDKTDLEGFHYVPHSSSDSPAKSDENSGAAFEKY